MSRWGWRRRPQRRRPNGRNSWTRWAGCTYKKNLPELAIPLFESCVKKAPGNSAYHHHLGLAYFKAGRSAQARAALQRALSNNPDASTADAVKRALAQIGPA